ncbi:N-acetylmuramoyl-L-alanine amidase [Latilactobacillus sakei]|uniref:peptidoglycan recognition protein family protein n=1 Tax=Latilactobacillus sakei TaxID=1599 RepID=UPI0038F70306
MTRFSNLITSENPNTMYSGSRNGVKIDRIVIHHNATTNKNVAMSTWYTSSGNWTSAHYEVTPTEIIGCVEEGYAAYHCGGTGGYDVPKMSNPNERSIGIENVNSTGAPSWSVDPRTVANTAKLVRDICNRYGIPCDRRHVLAHNEVTATACPGGLDVDEVVRLANGGSASTPTKPVTPTPSKPTPKVNVTYSLRNLNGGWNGDVTNFNNSDSNGFSGVPNGRHDLLTVSVNHGSVKYRAHTVGHGWNGWITGSNKNDTVNGCAGIAGHPIDGVQVIYITPNGEGYQQAYYRSQTTQRAGWLAVACDDGNSINGFDGFAGMIGEPLDRLQIGIADHNPF